MSDKLQTYWWQQAHQAVRDSAGREPDWLTEYRSEQLERYEATGLPDKKVELWKYTDIHRLEALLGNNLDTDWELQLDDDERARCVIVVSDYGIEVHGSLPAGVRLKPVAEAPRKLWKPFAYEEPGEGRGTRPGSQIQARAYAHVMVNQAAFKTGFWLQVADNTAVKRTVQVVYTQHEETCLHVNNIIEMGPGSRLTLRQCAQPGAIINVVNRQWCGENACLNVGNRHHLADRSAFLTHTHTWLTEGAEQHSLTSNHAGHLSRHQQDIVPQARNPRHSAGVIHRADGASHLCSISQSLLHKPEARTHVVMRALAEDRAASVVNCAGVVYPGNDDCVVEQSLKNLLLSDSARIYSKPALEIYADEVEAAHGSTIGALDEQAMFYLRARGIPADQARDMLIQSFLSEAIELDDAPWREQFSESLKSC